MLNVNTFTITVACAQFGEFKISFQMVLSCFASVYLSSFYYCSPVYLFTAFRLFWSLAVTFIARHPSAVLTLLTTSYRIIVQVKNFLLGFPLQ